MNFSNAEIDFYRTAPLIPRARFHASVTFSGVYKYRSYRKYRSDDPPDERGEDVLYFFKPFVSDARVRERFAFFDGENPSEYDFDGQFLTSG